MDRGDETEYPRGWRTCGEGVENWALVSFPKKQGVSSDTFPTRCGQMASLELVNSIKLNVNLLWPLLS